MANEFKVRKGLIVQGSGSIILDIQGSQGELFSVTDSLSGSLFSVNDISGIPIMEVFSDNTIKMGTFNQEAIIVSGSRTGMGIATPQAKLHISGANNDSLFRIQSPASASIMFVSGSGNVGIGTNLPSADLHISGTSADSLLRVGSPTNSNILLVSGSGFIGVNRVPGVALDVQGSIRSDGTMFNSTTQTQVISANSIAFLRFLSASVETARYDNNGWGFFNTAPTAKVHISGANTDALFRISSPSATNTLFVTGSGNVGIGTNLPSADLHISGTSADNLLRVGSPSNANILFVTGSGRVGINTTSSVSLFDNNISTFTIFQNSGSGDGLTPSVGLQVVNSGSSANAQANISIVTMGDKFASLSIGTSGSSTINNYWQFSKRNAASSHAFQLYNNNNGTFSSPLFSFVRSGISTLGENNQIQIDDATGYIGLQGSPSDYIHLYSSPGGGNYLRIDATSIQAPPLTTLTPNTGYGITTNKYYLAEPDYWMEISLDGAIVLIPCYLPA